MQATTGSSSGKLAVRDVRTTGKRTGGVQLDIKAATLEVVGRVAVKSLEMLAGADDAGVIQSLRTAKDAFQAAAERHRAADAEARHVDARHKYLFKLLVARFQAAEGVSR